VLQTGRIDPLRATPGVEHARVTHSPLAFNLHFTAPSLTGALHRPLRRDQMLHRFIVTGMCVCTAMLAWAQPARAQQTVNFTLGYFTPLGEDARTTGDVLNANLNAGRYGLFYEIDDFNSASVGGEWLFPIGNFIEGGIGVSFSRQTVSSVYQNFIDSDGTEIDQDLRLRLVP